MYFLTALKNTLFTSLDILTLHIPSFAAAATSSSGFPEPPCKTNGISVMLLISLNISKFSFGLKSFGYRPCAVPIATANVSTLVLCIKSSACRGSA